MTTYQVLDRHDIPVQVKASEGRNRRSLTLSDRFQEAVDMAAMAAYLHESDAYTEQYQWSEPQERDGSPDEVAQAVAAELEAQYPTVDWHKTADALMQWSES